MAEDEIVWPWGMTEADPDPASRPLVFRPRGFMVAILEDAEAAERAKDALVAGGFPDSHLRIFTGRQLLEDRERFVAQQSVVRRVVENVTIDSEAVELFLRYAHDGRAFLWVYVPQREDANRAMRDLSTQDVLHYRYYGDETVEVIHVR